MEGWSASSAHWPRCVLPSEGEGYCFLAFWLRPSAEGEGAATALKGPRALPAPSSHTLKQESGSGQVCQGTESQQECPSGKGP